MKKMRIGIPRALLYYRYHQTWDILLKELGYEVIYTPETTSGILKDGIRNSLADICLPVKTFLGHVKTVADSVDCLFIPRYISVEHDAYMCPKILGLPDIVRACFPRLPSIIDPMINVKKDRGNTVAEFSKQLAHSLNINSRSVERVISGNFPDHSEMTDSILPYRSPFLKGDSERIFREIMGGKKPAGEKVRIGLVGRPYLLFDRHLGNNLFTGILDLDAYPVYLEPSEREIREAMTVIPKWVYWSLGKEVVTSAHTFFKDDVVDGVINVCSATCGPDSFTGDLIRKRLNHRNKPYMSLVIDEHTSNVGIQTRLEAFVDMLRPVSV